MRHLVDRRPVTLVPAAAGLTLLLAGCAGVAGAAGLGQRPTPGSTTVSRASSSAVALSMPVSASASTPETSAAVSTVTSSSVRTLRAPAGLPWKSVPGSPALSTAALDGGTISLLWMDPTRLRFRYVPGTLFPEGGPATAADNTPSTWLTRMVAGFNGGFMLKDHVGGYYYLGRTVAPLRPGYAAFVITKSGALSVGVWGRDLRMSPNVLVVRENLRPLVDHGVSQASPADGPRTWGLAINNAPLVNRSALGRLPNGSLIFAFGASVRASTLAASLVRAGVTEAVMLDMNVTWPTGYTYTHVAGHPHGTRINYHIVRPPTIYFTRFRKDFVAVLSS
jgi:hypothetical protein